MNIPRLAIIGVFVALIWLGICETAAHAANHVKAPVVKAGLPVGPCNEFHVGDIEIIEGVLYECGCNVRLFIPNDCGWEEITSQAEDPMRFRRIVRRARALHHRVIVIHTLPAVVA